MNLALINRKQNSQIGKRVIRREDARLLSGLGKFTDDAVMEDQTYAVMLRSIHAHAKFKIISIDTAKEMPGVIEILIGEDWLDDGLNPMPAWGNPADVALSNRDGSELFFSPLFPLAIDRVRRSGEIIAVVIANTHLQAIEAAENINIKYNVLKSVSDAANAIKPNAPVIWNQAMDNITVDDEKGNINICKEAFDNAAHIIKLETFNQRVTGVPMEPRAALANFEARENIYYLEAGSQGANRLQNELAATFGINRDKIRVVSNDVGGGYGTRNHTYPEFALCLWAAKKTGRPVKWVCDRSEAFLSDYSGRDLLTKAELAIDDSGNFQALKTENLANIGTHTISYVPLARGPTVYNGVYNIPIGYAVSKAVLTNTNAVVSYRGAGRPEAMFIIERMIDMAAKKVGIDRIELRRRNIIQESSIPYTNNFNVTYDSGNFPKNMEMALRSIDWFDFPSRRKKLRKKGYFAGIGIANYIETATGYPQERAEMRIKGSGTVEIIIGTQSSGQSHETTFTQVISDWLGIDSSTILLRTGDTSFVKNGSGSHSCRSLRLAGHLFRQTTDEVIKKGLKICEIKFGTPSSNINYLDGYYVNRGTNKKLHLFEVAKLAETEFAEKEFVSPLIATAEISTFLPTYPNGCHACEIIIDKETGVVKVSKYIGVDDVGTVVNPMVVDGQTHGGIVQGLGQALMEECLYDKNNSQLLSGSFMDYAMPRANDAPSFELAFNEVPAPNNYLGVKGGGEGGTTAAPAAIVNAIVDALDEFQIDHIDMPATPEKIWRIIHDQ